MESAKGKGQEKAGCAGEGTVLQAVVLRCIDSLSILVVSRKAFVLSPPSHTPHCFPVFTAPSWGQNEAEALKPRDESEGEHLYD